MTAMVAVMTMMPASMPMTMTVTLAVTMTVIVTVIVMAKVCYALVSVFPKIMITGGEIVSSAAVIVISKIVAKVRISVHETYPLVSSGANLPAQ